MKKLPSSVLLDRPDDRTFILIRNDDCIQLTDADVARLANLLPVCDACGSFAAECICDKTATKATE